MNFGTGSTHNGGYPTQQVEGMDGESHEIGGRRGPGRERDGGGLYEMVGMK